MEGFSRKIAKEQKFLENQNYLYIQELLEKYPPGYTFEDILNELYGENNQVEKEELRLAYSDYLRDLGEKEGLARIEDWQAETKLARAEARVSRLENLELLEEYKKRMTSENIFKFRDYLKTTHPNEYPSSKDSLQYWVGAYARELANEYLRAIQKGITDQNLERIALKIKDFYYAEKFLAKFKRNDNYRDFYDSENDDNEELFIQG